LIAEETTVPKTGIAPANGPARVRMGTAAARLVFGDIHGEVDDKNGIQGLNVTSSGASE
jgi:hypothetical protein